MHLFVSIRPPDEILDYLESCIAELANMNKRLAIRWSDRSLLVASVLDLGQVEESAIPEAQRIIDSVAAKQSEFFVALSAPELVFNKGKKPIAISMSLFDQSGILPSLQQDLEKSCKKVSGAGIETRQPSILLGKIKLLKPRQKVKLITGHIDSVFPVAQLHLSSQQPTRIGIIIQDLHTSEVKHA